MENQVETPKHQCRNGAVETMWCVFEAEWIYSVCPEEETPLLIFLSFGRSNPFYFCPAVSAAATFHLQLTFCCMATFLKYLCSAGKNASIWLQKSIDSTSTVVAFTQHRWLLRPQRLVLTVKPNKLTENLRGQLRSSATPLNNRYVPTVRVRLE